MRRPTVSLVLLVFLGTAAWAQWPENGKLIADRPWAKTDGELGAALAFTDKPDELFAAWEKPSPGLRLSETSTAVRGVPIVGVTYFTGCVANQQGHCELVARFTTMTPQGKPWGNPIDTELWVGKPPPAKEFLQLSEGNLGIIIDPVDTLGVYMVKAVKQ